MEKEKSPAAQGRKALTIPKRSDGMPDYKAVTEFAKLNSITTLKDLEKLGNPIFGIIQTGVLAGCNTISDYRITL